MRNHSLDRAKLLLACAAGLMLAFACVASSLGADSTAPKRTGVLRTLTRGPSQESAAGGDPVVPAGARIDPAHVTYKWPSQIEWHGRSGGPRMATLLGDSTKPGFYIVLMKFPPHMTSRPHFHPYDRYATVISGTWWVGTGTKFDLGAMVPMPAGSFVIDHAGQVHYDGAKDQQVIIEICGQGPVTMTPADTK